MSSEEDDNKEEVVSTGEMVANFLSSCVCSSFLAYQMGWPSAGILAYLMHLFKILFGGYVSGHVALMVFGMAFAAFVKHVWRLPVSSNSDRFSDEAYAILFQQSSEAQAVARRRSCEVDHLVYACSDLDRGVDEIYELTRVKPVYGGSHAAFGTHNAHLSLDNGAYLEIIAPDPKCKNKAKPRVFGLDNQSSNKNNALVAFAVHPNPSTKGATFELIAQSIILAAGGWIDSISSGERQTPNGNMLRWRFTNPLCAHGIKAFVIDWGNAKESPAHTAPTGCKLCKLIFYCPNEEQVEAASTMHRRIGLGGRIPVVIERSNDGTTGMVAELMTPQGRKVFLGEQKSTKTKQS